VGSMSVTGRGPYHALSEPSRVPRRLLSGAAWESWDFRRASAGSLRAGGAEIRRTCSGRNPAGHSPRTRRRPSYFGEITFFDRTYSRRTSSLGRPVSVHSIPFSAQGAK